MTVGILEKKRNLNCCSILFGFIISSTKVCTTPLAIELISVLFCFFQLQSISPEVLCSSVSDIGTVISMTDRIAGSAPCNGSRAAVGEDLVAMTKCRLQARNFMSQDGSAIAKKMKRRLSALPLTVGSAENSFRQSDGHGISEFESTVTPRVKRQKAEVCLIYH